MLSFNSERHGFYQCSEAQLDRAAARYQGYTLDEMVAEALERSEVDFSDVSGTTAMLIIMGEWEVI